MKRILSITLVLTMIFGMLSTTADAEKYTASAITWNTSDKDLAREIGYKASTRSNASGDKISSNGNSSDFPGIFFIWDSKQKDNGYLKVSADVFKKYDSFVLTSKESNRYWDFKIEVQDGQEMTNDGSYVFFIPKVNNNKNINMVFIENFIPKLAVEIDNMQPVYGQKITANAIMDEASTGKNLTFQWQVQESRISDQYINVKSNGTHNSYTVPLNDIGKKLRVVVSQPNGDSKTSLPTNAVLNANPLITSIKFDNNLKDDANQEDLTANGDYSYVDGVLPGTKALHLEGGNYVGTKHSLNFGKDSFTVSFWYKGDTKNNQVIVSNKDFSNGSNAGWAIYTPSNSVKMNLGFPTESVKNISLGRNTFDASDWRYVTYVVDRNKMLASSYIDGYKMDETTLKLGTLDTSNPLNIGSDGLGNLGGNSFDIADLMIWKGVFSNDVVQANYNSYAVNKVDMNALTDTISEANKIIAGGLGNGFSETDFDYLKKLLNTANTVATTQNEKLYTQETINYYERELNNALFIYEKSNKSLTPADLNMIVDSDPEISSNPDSIARVEANFRKELKVFPQADVMFIPGDVTGGNNAIEYLWMNELTGVYDKLKNEGLFDDTAFYMVRGNHDMGGSQNLIPVGSAGTWNDSTNSYDNHFFNDSYRVKVKGYNIVGFDGNYDNDKTSGKAKKYLDEITKEADYDPTKPIFVSSHFPISGTNWGSGWSSAGSNNVGKYIADNNLSQVVYLSGHTHYDPTDERSLNQGAATYLDAGSTSYSSYIDGGQYGGYIEGAYINYNTAPRIANFIEVYGPKIIIKQYNLSTDEFVGIPFVANVGEGKEAFTYSKSDTRELIAPEFDEAITVNSSDSNEFTFTIKQANDNVRVLEYNVQFINKLTGEVDKSFNSLSLPLDNPYKEYRQYKTTGLLPKTPYILRVFAVDSMNNRSSQDIDIITDNVNVSLSVDKQDYSVMQGSTEQINVTEVTTVDGEVTEIDVTDKATYVVEDETIASVMNGLITAKAQGSTKVTISYGGEEVTVNVTVTETETITMSADRIKALVERFEEEGEFKNGLAARILKTHLIAVDLYEKQEAAEKVVKHMKGFKVLLDHQLENELISEKGFKALQADAELLIKKWQ